MDTRGDFWKMILENQITCIAMIANFKEKGVVSHIIQLAIAFLSPICFFM